MFFPNRKLKLKKRDCPIKMWLVPYGGGWTDVHLDIGGDHLYFIITSSYGHQFGDFLQILYHLHPNCNDPENADHLIESKVGLCVRTTQGYQVVKVADSPDSASPGTVVRDIPWRAQFTWDEEGAESRWTLERIPNTHTEFNLKIHIEHQRSERKVYDYEVAYRDLCYAVAKACTDMLKEYGFFGYHYSVYFQDLNVRHLLFLKSVALDNFEARKLTCYEEKGHGETSDFQKELELLLFDM